MLGRERHLRSLAVLIFAALFLLTVTPRVRTYPPYLAKAKALGLPAQDCAYCHVNPTGGDPLGPRAEWLRAEKEKRGASQIDIAWLKEYLPDQQPGAAKGTDAAHAADATAKAAQASGGGTAAAPSQTTFPAAGGDIQITPIFHASTQIEFAGKVIHIDPWSQGDYSKAKQADLILVSDIHSDHLDPAAIAKIRKAGAPIVAPEAAAPKLDGATVIANGETKTVAGISIEAVPMYNLQRGPAAGQLYHTKGRGNGYILTLGGKRLYFAGDTECTPEMKNLKNIDVAFVPMNLPYTMTPAEAAECVKAYQPKVVIPYHYRNSNPQEFAGALKGESVEVRFLEYYPGQKGQPQGQ